MSQIDQAKALLSANEVYQVKVLEGRSGKIKIAHDVPLPRGTIELEIAKIIAREYGILIALMEEGNPYRNEFMIEIEITAAIEVLPAALTLIAAKKHFDRALHTLAKLAVEQGAQEEGKSQMVT